MSTLSLFLLFVFSVLSYSYADICFSDGVCHSVSSLPHIESYKDLDLMRIDPDKVVEFVKTLPNLSHGMVDLFEQSFNKHLARKNSTIPFELLPIIHEMVHGSVLFISPGLSPVCQRLFDLNVLGVTYDEIRDKYCREYCSWTSEIKCDGSHNSFYSFIDEQAFRDDAKVESERAKVRHVSIPMAISAPNLTFVNLTGVATANQVFTTLLELKYVLIPLYAVASQTIVSMVTGNKNAMARFLTLAVNLVLLLFFSSNWIDVAIFGFSIIYVSLFDGYKHDRFDRIFSTVVLLTCFLMTVSIFVDNTYFMLGACFIMVGFYVYSARIALSSRIAIDTTYAIQIFIVGALYVRLTMALLIVEGRSSIYIGSMYHVFYAVLPIGHAPMLYQNYYMIAVSLFQFLHYQYSVPNALNVTMLLMVSALVLFFLARSLYGLFMLRNIKSSLTVNDLLWGFYIYCIDIWAPLRIFTHFGDYSKKGLNILFLSTLATLSMYMEAFYAREFLAIRFILWFFDAVNITPYSAYKAILLYRSGSHIDLASFKQIGSRPFVDLDVLLKLKDCVHTAILTTNDAVKQGTCAVFTTSNNIVKILTVNHVSSGGSVKFEDGKGASHSVTSPFKAIGGDMRDPITAAPLINQQSSLQLGFLSLSEVSLLDHLMVVKRNGLISMITQFTFDKASGLFNAAVDLESGDSGSPIIGVLKDSSIRYAGAVSRGNPDTAGGNLLTAICGGGVRLDGGSPGSTDERPPIVRKLFASYNEYLNDIQKLDESIAKVDPNAQDAKSQRDRFKNQKKNQRANFRPKLQGLALSISDPVAARVIELFDSGVAIKFAGNDATNVEHWT
jgi:hypothetical protein